MPIDHTYANLRQAALELIRRAATRLPDDVRQALRAAHRREPANSPARSTLAILNRNADWADTDAAPLCQDTGTLSFYGRIPPQCPIPRLNKAIAAAVRAATRVGMLRQNTIDTLTGQSVADNVAPGSPQCRWETAAIKHIDLWLLMKGGGCENTSTQFSLPDTGLNAGRDLDGVRRCLLQAVVTAQGHGCAPSILGVCIGGDRQYGYETAKRQFLRPLTDQAAQPELAALERRILRDANTLGIGPMGLGGKTTLLGVKIAAVSRLPASYFVSVATMCWALRRAGIRLNEHGQIERWLQP